MSSAPLPDELRKDLWHPVREWYARRLARAGELLLAFHLPSIGPLVDATGRPAPWHLARGSLSQRMALDKPRPNPTCRLCEKAILPGVPRYRRGVTSVHVECEEGKEESQPKSGPPQR